MNDACKLLRAQSSTADPANGMTGQSCEADCAPDSDVDSFYLSDMFVSGNSLNGYSALKDAADFVEEVDDTDFGRDVHNFEITSKRQLQQFFASLEDETSSEEPSTYTSR
ncbi:hypothetical protein HBH98_247050 [Parastagonospora nodorum]|nr:hypothetical protein HBH53_251020 [Parastagonospora nodorum]KAH4333542.1 hypothetical protein HBH98_247050 [Parastagonospora nodorum]KAH4368429.1 hypothetical protein HBH99_247740 [Parastagonospora nodorum]KAH4890842.1 hypothetical protein HBH74_234410 [Parastagonospora nodorum]KAH4893339.1 hypothetical protein HBI80_249280 [Parastagonospora nodorum]